MFKLNERDAEIVFIGDSITSRGTYDEYFSDKKVLNRGIGSDVAEGVYNRIDEIISHHPSKIFIMIGINDIAKEISFDESIDFYKKKIKSIHSQLPACEIYVESVLPTITEAGDKIVEYNNRLQEMCIETDTRYVNLYDLFLNDLGELNNILMSDDDIHLNGEGYKVIIKELEHYIY